MTPEQMRDASLLELFSLEAEAQTQVLNAGLLALERNPTQADLVNAYREAHVTALASEGEAFGLVLVESLACGTPAVGNSEATPLTFDGSAHDLAQKILDAAWLDADNCREQARRFDVRKTARAHETLYNQVRAARQR